MQRSIFRRGDRNLDLIALAEVEHDTSVQLSASKWVRSWDEHIHFDHGLEVDQIER